MLKCTWIVLFLYVFFDGAGSFLIVRPCNTVAIQGQPVNLTCRTNLTVDDIVWQFSNATGHPQRDVIYRQGLNPIMRARGITVEKYDLRFESVNMSDAGTYMCQEVDRAAPAWITVLEAEPQCWNETITKESDTSAVILLRCNVTYNGSLARQHDTNRLVPRTNWTCDPGVQLLVNNTTDDRVSPSQPTMRTLTSSAVRSLGSSAAGACRFLLYFETVTTDEHIDRAHPVYRFEWTHGISSSILHYDDYFTSSVPLTDSNTQNNSALFVTTGCLVVAVVVIVVFVWRSCRRRLTAVERFSQQQKAAPIYEDAEGRQRQSQQDVQQEQEQEYAEIFPLSSDLPTSSPVSAATEDVSHHEPPTYEKIQLDTSEPQSAPKVYQQLHPYATMI